MRTVTMQVLGAGFTLIFLISTVSYYNSKSYFDLICVFLHVLCFNNLITANCKCRSVA